MTDSLTKILFLADTHLGFDLPIHPRINRRRRGPDFFENFNRALEPALRGEVDLVVHGGDIFYRSRVPAVHVTGAFEPILKIAEQGTPVFIVPGNHERSRIPHSLFAKHPNIHIFDRPKTFTSNSRGATLSLSGFPYHRNDIRNYFKTLVDQTGIHQTEADVSILCIHQIVEGAKVGPRNYTFRTNSDVIKGREIPRGFAAVLCGHVHRAQVLSSDLSGKPLESPVLYPGAIERTSVAEKDEEKGYFIIRLAPSSRRGGSLLSYSFVRLPTRPMYDIPIDVIGLDNGALRSRLVKIISSLDPDGVVRVKVHGPFSEQTHPVLNAASLRSLAPPTMNIHLAHNVPSQPQR
jgi:exonuclease SbcD